MKKLAIVITHPIQYYVPVFQRLAKACGLKVFYTWGPNWLSNKFDPGFGKEIKWDIPLLDGYTYEFLYNVSQQPGSHHRKGIDNPDIINKLEDFSPDTILVHGYNYKSHFRVMRYFKGKIPIWFRGDSTLLNKETLPKSFLKKIYLSFVYSYIDKAFYVGKNNKAYFLAFGLKETQLFFCPHAIDNEHFAKDRTNEVLQLKSRLGFNKDDIIVLYAGKFEEVKNLPKLISAFLKLKTAKQVKLLLVGNGPLETELKKQAKGNPNIIFMDFQNQGYLPVVYQCCDIFCLPSYSETWGLAVNEAMAAGKAILVSDKVGCAADLVFEDLNGRHFNANSIDNLTIALSDLIHSPDLETYKLNSSQIIRKWNFHEQTRIIKNELSK